MYLCAWKVCFMHFESILVYFESMYFCTSKVYFCTSEVYFWLLRHNVCNHCLYAHAGPRPPRPRHATRHAQATPKLRSSMPCPRHATPKPRHATPTPTPKPRPSHAHATPKPRPSHAHTPRRRHAHATPNATPKPRPRHAPKPRPSHAHATPKPRPTEQARASLCTPLFSLRVNPTVNCLGKKHPSFRTLLVGWVIVRSQEILSCKQGLFLTFHPAHVC